MERMEEFTTKMSLPPVTQIGVVVKDMEQAIRYYSRTLGLGPFSPVTDLVPDKNWYRGESHPVHLRTSRAMWGAMEFELVQPLGGKSVHGDFLETHGEGLHHLGIETSQYDEIVGMMDRAGFKPLQVVEIFLPKYNCWGKATFFDTRSVGGIIIEVVCRPWLAKI
jgi:catechol 2,3-dioxygenase-like lactoylglutathione lyase family enzyme